MSPSYRRSRGPLLLGAQPVKTPLHPLAIPHASFGPRHHHAPLLHSQHYPQPHPPPHHFSSPPQQQQQQQGQQHMQQYSAGGRARQAADAGPDAAASDQELMLRSWRRDGRTIALGAGLGVLVLVLVSAAAALLGAGPGPRPARDPYVSLSDVLLNRYAANLFNGTWLQPPLSRQPNARFVYISGDDFSPLMMDLRKDETLSLLPNGSLVKDLFVLSYRPSPDARYLLVQHNISSIGADYMSMYAVIDRRRWRVWPLEGPYGPLLRHVLWSPAGGGALAFVQRNDLFYVPNVEALENNATETSRGPPIIRLTHSGVPGKVYNGVPTFAYVDVFRMVHALWFAPDGRRLVFASFNDSAVGEVQIPVFLPLRQLKDDYYPHGYTVRYPKPGTPLPDISLWLVDLQEAVATAEAVQLHRLVPPQQLLDGRDALGGGGDGGGDGGGGGGGCARTGVGGRRRPTLLGAVTWASAEEVAATWANRAQDVLKVALYDAAAGGALSAIFYSCEATGAWVDVRRTTPLFDGRGRRAVLLADAPPPHDFPHILLLQRHPRSDSSEGATRHPLGPAPSRTFLTSGPYAVTEILAWDEGDEIIYFLGTGYDEPAQQFLYSVGDSSAGAPRPPLCISCGVRFVPPAPPAAPATPAAPSAPCLHASASFSADAAFYVLTCNGPDVPHVAVYNKSHELLWLWEDNAEVRGRVATKVLPATHTAWLQLRGGRARVRLWLPPNYDIAKAKYPLLLDVCGDPDQRARISDEYHVDWRAHLAANRSIVYAVVEARGSRLHGAHTRYAVRGRLGADDVEDQIDAIKELIERFNFIDGRRVGVWGWSYGGWLAGMVFAKDTSRTVRCAIAIAPIVSWRHYNALHSERILRPPRENERGYDDADLSRAARAAAADLRAPARRLLLAHGTQDSRVHFAHSLLLARELQQADVPFTMLTFPDEEHSLFGSKMKLYRRMEEFLGECFPLD